ncbi:MAG: hypothetical protein PHO46_07995 [Thermoguttaceae bacterium]|jgi:hypothetical protein|nr:hypothetical protein [Thermoguttaceae bacterium]
MYGRSSTAPLPGSSPQTEQATIWLEGRGARLYDPGETLSGFYSLSEIRRAAVDSVEISVLWRTEGKGNEDVGVHAFWKLSVQAGDWIDPLRPCRFSTKLPKSPLSYEGNLIKICWYARIRAFLSTGEQVVDETPFRLGDLPDMRALKLYADHDS